MISNYKQGERIRKQSIVKMRQIASAAQYAYRQLTQTSDGQDSEALADGAGRSLTKHLAAVVHLRAHVLEVAAQHHVAVEIRCLLRAHFC